MDRVALIEGIVLLMVGIASLVDGIRLNVTGKVQLYDVLGPGNYNIGLGVIIIILCLLYFAFYLKKSLDRKKVLQEKRFMKKMISMIVVFVAYIFLIKVIGYFLASMVFFSLTFKIAGFKSWLIVGVLSTGISISFYAIFVYWLNIVFPQSVLFSF